MKFYDIYPFLKKRKNKVIYPFFDINHFNLNKVTKQSYFLFNSRHEKNKRIEEVIDIFKKNKNINLVITNSGSLTNILIKKNQKFKNIKFKNNLTFKGYLSILKNSKCVIMIPKNEDFGMSAIEALACNKPVISVKEGGLKEIFPNDYKLHINKNDITKSLNNIVINFENYNLKGKYFKNISKKFEITFFIKELTNAIKF